jgi:hypothetical protein
MYGIVAHAFNITVINGASHLHDNDLLSAGWQWKKSPFKIKGK